MQFEKELVCASEVRFARETLYLKICMLKSYTHRESKCLEREDSDFTNSDRKIYSFLSILVSPKENGELSPGSETLSL